MMKAVNFIKCLPICMGALLYAGASFSCKAEKPEKFIGIQLWSVRDAMKTDVPGTIKQLGEMGYKFVETAGYADGKFYNMEPLAFKNLVESNGMKFISSHTGQIAPVTDEQWAQTMQWWDVCIEAHKAAGVKYIVQPFMGGEAYESIANIANYCKYFNAVGQKCNNNGIRFGYHNHDGEFKELDGEIIYDYMLNNTQPELVTFQLDLYWIKKGGKDALEYFEKYPGRFELYHVKDEAELGAGDAIDFAPYFENAEKAGMKYYIVEVERYNFSSIESVKVSFDFLNSANYTK